MNNLVGVTLLNRYRVQAFIGRGGMAAVYKAWDAMRLVSIAIKVLNPDLAEDYVFLRRFAREARALEALQHSHIVRFFGFEEAKGLAFIVMEYVEGITLRRYLRLLERPLTLSEALYIVQQVCSALHYAHRMGIYHCDIKPGNIFIEQGGRVVLADFGLARLTESTTTAFSTSGSPAYMPPEQARGEEVDARADVYSLGITTYEMLTLNRPFKGDAGETTASRGERVRWEQLHLPPPPPRDLNLHITPEAEVAILRALEKDPSRRQQTALAFYQQLSQGGSIKAAASLAEMADTETRVAMPAISPRRVLGPKARQPRGPAVWAWVLVGLLVIVALAVGVGVSTGWREGGSVWLWVAGLSGLGMALLVGFYGISRSSDLYRRLWESSIPLERLVILLISRRLDAKQIEQRLAGLHVPVGADQIDTALNTAVQNGLVLRQGDRYRLAKPVLAWALQVREGLDGQRALVEQIQGKHPLCADARRFLEQASLTLTPSTEPLVYRCEPTSTSLRRLLPSTMYARFIPGEALDGSQVLTIRDQVKRVDAQASVVFVVTDQRPTDQGWAQIGTLRMDSFVILPIEHTLLYTGLATGRESALLCTEVEKRMGADYDPYDVRDPVAGAFGFFGRDALVEDLLRRLYEGRPVGIFGLRKLGKSSLLQALRDRASFPVAAVNLQTVGYDAPLDELYMRILQYWGQWARARFALDFDLPAVTPDDPTGSFVTATLVLLGKLEEHQEEVRLGLLLDEVELIVPRSDGSGADLQRYLTFLRAVRGLIDEDGRLSLVVASLDSSINRINAWNYEQNPTFNLFQEIYLPPLAKEDCIQMVRNIGQQVGLIYSDESLEAIAALSGGHPFLARQLCSVLYRQRRHQPGRIEATDIPAGVERFIYDDDTVKHLDGGIWQDAGNPALWGEAQTQINQALLLKLARADGPVSQDVLLNGSDADLRRTSLINLERFHFIHQPEPGVYTLRYGLLRTWLRRRKLGLE